MKKVLLLAASIVILSNAAFALSMTSASFDNRISAVSGGGNVSVSANFALAGGHTDAGGESTSASFSLFGGIYAPDNSQGAITPTLTPTPVLGWREETLSPSEAIGAWGANDTQNTASIIPYGVLYQTGGGHIGINNYYTQTYDIDNYRFTIPGTDNIGDHNMLMLQVYVPEGGYSMAAEIMEYSAANWNSMGAGYADGGNTITVVADISTWSGTAHDFIARIVSNRGMPLDYYRVTVSVLDSGFVSGTINAVGATDLSGIKVGAYSKGVFVGFGITDAAGNYSARVPVAAQIGYLGALRNWYSGAPADWAYGRTAYRLPAAVSVNTAGGNTAGNNFNSYREGSVEGTIVTASEAEIEILDRYTGDVMGTTRATSGYFAIHNLPYGNYDIFAKPVAGYGHGLGATLTSNVLVRDGFAADQNITLSAGYTLSGTFIPAIPAGVTLTVRAYRMGMYNSFMKDEFSDYYSVTVTAAQGAYQLYNLPQGKYTVVAGGSGPSMWAPVGINLISNSVGNFLGPSLGSTISGTVNDTTGTYSYSNMSIYALVTGTADVMSLDARGYISKVDNAGNFTVQVPSSYPQYDLFVAYGKPGSDGGDPIIGRKYGIGSGTTGNVIDINAGVKVYGDVSYKGTNIAYYKQKAFVQLFKDEGAGYKFHSFAETSGVYSITGVEPGNYRLRADNFWMSTYTYDLAVGASDTQVNINLNSVNAANDLYMPYSGELIVNHTGMQNDANDLLYFTLSDHALGTGLQAGLNIAVSAYSAVDVAFVDIGENARRYQFRIPPETRIPGTTNVIAINGYDNNGNVYSTGYVWNVTLATPFGTPTITNTVTPTQTPADTITATITRTVTASVTATVTGTITGTATRTATGTVTATVTATNTQTNTETVTRTVSPTVTATSSPSTTQTVTSTVTPTNSPTQSITATITRTNSPTSSITATVTQSVTLTVTSSVTQTVTATVTRTDSPTSSATRTVTQTVTQSITPTVTQTSTDTPLPTDTPTSTDTPTFTHTHTYTYTPTDTGTATYTPTFTSTFTFTSTYTQTNTFTETMTFTPSHTFTITPTFTNTPTPAIAVALDKNVADLSKGDKITIKVNASAADERITVKVFNLTGDPVAEFSAVTTASGWNNFEWDGRNKAGKKAGRGMYFIHIKTQNGNELRKIYIIK